MEQLAIGPQQSPQLGLGPQSSEEVLTLVLGGMVKVTLAIAPEASANPPGISGLPVTL
jgi:hypothetical protein